MQQHTVSLPVAALDRQPPGNMSALGGYTVAECIDKISKQEIENLRLKRRIYLMEESMGCSCDFEMGDPVMEYIKLKVMCSFSLRAFVCAASVKTKQL